jgi:hypothetical protein
MPQPRTRRGTPQRAFGLLLALALAFSLLSASSEDPATEGAFVDGLLIEPTIDGVVTEEKCLEREDGTFDCKPAAGGMALTANGTLMYFNSLEATENIQNGIALEFGEVAVNDQSRVLDLSGDQPSWRVPSPVDGGASNGPGDYVLPEELVNGPDHNDGAFFCPGMFQLADGSVMVVGGTDWWTQAPHPSGDPSTIAPR